MVVVQKMEESQGEDGRSALGRSIGMGLSGFGGVSRSRKEKGSRV